MGPHPVQQYKVSDTVGSIWSLEYVIPKSVCNNSALIFYSDLIAFASAGRGDLYDVISRYILRITS